MRHEQLLLTISTFMAAKAFIIAISVGLFGGSDRYALVFIAAGCLFTSVAFWLRRDVAHEAWRQGYRAAYDDSKQPQDDRITRIR